MVKTFVFVVLGLAVALGIVLNASPTPARDLDPAVYAWEYLEPGSDRLVCQKLSLHIQPLPQTKTTHAQSVRTHSQIVRDRFCANLSKPVISHQ